MLPGLSNVLRRDKERQRAAAAGLDSLPAGQGTGYYSSSPQGHPLRRDDSGGSSSSATMMQSVNRVHSPPSRQHPQQHPQSMQQHPPTVPRSSAQHGMLPEEHRAREKEREKLARAHLGNTHTQQMMANRQLQSSISPSKQQQNQDGGQNRVSRVLTSISRNEPAY